MDQIFSKMEGSNAAIGTYYYGDYLTHGGEQPRPGLLPPRGGHQHLRGRHVHPKGAANKENAEAFINYMCSTQAGLMNCEEIWYSTPLMSVREELDPEVSSDPMAYPDAEIMAQCESYTNLPRTSWICTPASGCASSVTSVPKKRLRRFFEKDCMAVF